MPVIIILLILLAVILVRTFLFTPKDEPAPVPETVDFDREETSGIWLLSSVAEPYPMKIRHLKKMRSLKS